MPAFALHISRRQQAKLFWTEKQEKKKQNEIDDYK
jgi:hypothetical protein